MTTIFFQLFTGGKNRPFRIFSGVKGLDLQTCDFFIYQNMLLYIHY